MFQLVFKGECTSGTELSAARSNAQALFKASLEQVDRMFSGKAVVIRNKLDEAQAEKYKQVLQKHGMVAYVEPMPEARSPEPAPEKPSRPAPGDAGHEPQGRAGTASASPAASQKQRPPTRAGEEPQNEPGDRPNVAGEKVDDILAGSSLSLDPVGITLAEYKETPPPMFQHLDTWTLAPVGSDLVEKRQAPAPKVPDVSHLSLAANGSEDKEG
jgi:hypothetical protein